MKSISVTVVALASLALLGACTVTTTTNTGDDVDSGTTGTPDASTPHDGASTTPEASSPDTSTTPDATTNPDAPPGACDLVAQTGCGVNQKCTLDQGGAAVCGATGTTATGAVCGNGGADDCKAGDFCGTDSKNGTAMCQQFCNKDADCTQPAVAVGNTAEPNNVGHCAIQITGTSAKLCTVACNPIAAAGPSGCPTGLACDVAATATVPELTACRTPGTVTEGNTCSQSATCGAGLICVGASASALHCRAVCRAGNNGDCTGGDTCVVDGSIQNPMFGACCPAGGC